KPAPAPRPIPDLVPAGKQQVRTEQQLVPDRRPFGMPIDHRLEIATQVRPTYLTLVERQPEVAFVPIRSDDLPRWWSNQALGDGPRAGGSDGEHRHRLGNDGP